MSRALIAFHEAHGRRATITAVAPPGRFGALEFDGDLVTRFREKPDGDGGRINGGFFVAEPSVLDLVDGPGCVWERGPLETLAASRTSRPSAMTAFWRPMDTLRDKLLPRQPVDQRRGAVEGLVSAAAPPLKNLPIAAGAPLTPRLSPNASQNRPRELGGGSPIMFLAARSNPRLTGAGADRLRDRALAHRGGGGGRLAGPRHAGVVA